MAFIDSSLKTIFASPINVQLRKNGWRLMPVNIREINLLHRVSITLEKISVCSLTRLLRLWQILWALLLLLMVNSLRAAWDFATIMQKSDVLYGPASAAAQQRINARQSS